MPASQLTRTLPTLWITPESITLESPSNWSSLFPTDDPLGRTLNPRPQTAAFAPAAINMAVLNTARDAEPSEAEVVFTSDGFTDESESSDETDAIDEADVADRLASLPVGALMMNEPRVQLGVDPSTGTCHLAITPRRSFRPRHNF